MCFTASFQCHFYFWVHWFVHCHYLTIHNQIYHAKHIFFANVKAVAIVVTKGMSQTKKLVNKTLEKQELFSKLLLFTAAENIIGFCKKKKLETC